MAKRRFVAPAREALTTDPFDAPIFAECAPHLDWLRGAHWPSIEALDARLARAAHPFTGHPLRFVAQDGVLLADGLHYEQRIHAQGAIATRIANWHDLFNAVAWLEQRALKGALNLRQAADVAHVGRARTRAQCALTHFDEAGAVVLLHDARLLQAWDAHDWHALFVRERSTWSDGRIRLRVFGHALREHALVAGSLPTAKCLVAWCEDRRPAIEIEDALAQAIARGDLLADPQELRPLPLDGVPGWHPANADPAFYAEAACFRPLRSGRRYPPPWHGA